MTTCSSVLLLSPATADHHRLERLLQRLACPLEVTHSVTHALTAVITNRPCLLIIQGNAHRWSRFRLSRLREIADADHITLLSLSDSHTQSWLSQEDNPGFDGFLVNPLSSEILNSVICAASARQLCRELAYDASRSRG